MVAVLFRSFADDSSARTPLGVTKIGVTKVEGARIEDALASRDLRRHDPGLLHTNLDLAALLFPSGWRTLHSSGAMHALPVALAPQEARGWTIFSSHDPGAGVLYDPFSRNSRRASCRD